MAVLPPPLHWTWHGLWYLAVATMPTWHADEDRRCWVRGHTERSRVLVIRKRARGTRYAVGWIAEEPLYYARSLERAKRLARSLVCASSYPPSPRMHWLPSSDRVPGMDCIVTFNEGMDSVYGG